MTVDGVADLDLARRHNPPPTFWPRCRGWGLNATACVPLLPLTRLADALAPPEQSNYTGCINVAPVRVGGPVKVRR